MLRGILLCGLAALAAPFSAAAQWIELTSPTDDTLRAVHFVDDETGWVVGYDGVVRRTTDGGLNWTPQTSGTLERLLAVSFADANTGFLNGGLYVARTIDGGANWDTLMIDPDARIFRNRGFATSPTTYWVPAACGTCVTRWFYRYTIDGNGMAIEEVFDFVESTAPFLDMHFVDADNGWAVSLLGFIRRITNASSATPVFAPQTSNTVNTLNGVFMLDALTGWAVGNAGTIRATTDGGANWNTQMSGTAENLRDVHFRDALNGWIVGDAGVILATVDGGATWTPETSTVGVPLFGVNAQSRFVYAVGGDLSTSTNGVALKRTDVIFADGFEG